MPVTIDNVDSYNGSATVHTKSFTVDSNATLLVVCTASSFGSDFSPPTWNGTPMTLIASLSNGDRAKAFYLPLPDTGTHDVVVTSDGGAFSVDMGIISFFDAGTISGLFADVIQTPTDNIGTTIVSSNDSIVVDLVYPNGQTPTNNWGSTSIFSTSSRACSYDNGAAVINTSWTIPTTGNQHMYIAFSVDPMSINVVEDVAVAEYAYPLSVGLAIYDNPEITYDQVTYDYDGGIILSTLFEAITVQEGQGDNGDPDLIINVDLVASATDRPAIVIRHYQ